MFKFLRRWMPIGISLLIFFAMLIPSFAESSDYQEHWASSEISKWVEKSIILGYPDGTFKPDRPITRAEFITVISRIFNFEEKSDKIFPDVPEGAWYADTVSKAVAAGIIEGDSSGKFNPDANITRQEAAVVFYRAFHLKTESTKAISRYADASSIASWSKDAVSAMTEKGYVSGRPGNIFAPADNITRAEAVKMIDNITNELKNAEGTYTGDVYGNLVVNTKDVVLKDMAIYGDLILAQGIGSGTVTLEGVFVNGRTVVLGGGEQSIILNNTNLKGTLLVIKYDGKVRIVAMGSTEASNILLNSGANLEEDEGLTGAGFGNIEIIEIPAGQEIMLEGDFDEVIVSAPGVGINVTDGSVGKLEITEEAENASVQISESATVNTLTVNVPANITGTGKIETANINVNNVVMEQAPANINLAKGITTTVAGKTVAVSTTTTPAATKDTTPSGGGPTTKKVSYEYPKMIKKDGSEIGADLSTQLGSVRIKGIKFTTNISAGQLKITEINSPNIDVVKINRTITISSSTPIISVLDVLGELAGGKEDISIGSMRGIFGEYVTIKGTLSGTGSYAGYTPFSTTIKITLGSADPTAVHSEWAEIVFDKDTATVTATLNADNYDDSVSDVRIGTLIMGATGGILPAEVGFSETYGAGDWYTVGTEDSQIKDRIAERTNTGRSWQQLKVEDLDGVIMYLTRAGDTTNKVYTLKIVK